MRHLLILFLILWSFVLNAQNTVPESINYQTVICDTSGNPLQNQLVSLRITILDSIMNGPEVYKEIWSSQATNQFGLVNLAIGRGSGQQIGGSTPTFSDIAWSSNPKIIKVEVDPNNGFNWQDMGRAELLTVPYAMHTKTAQNAEVAIEAQIAQFAKFSQIADSAGYAEAALTAQIADSAIIAETALTAHIADSAISAKISDFAQLADSALNAQVAEKVTTIISDAGVVRSEGGLGNGNNFDMLTLNVDLSGKEGRWMHVYGSTAMSEAINHSNVLILRLKIDNNVNDTTISAIRQGVGAYSIAPWDGNSTASMMVQGYFQIPSAYAVSNVTIILNGGVDGSVGGNSNFHWGDAPLYTSFDGENAGAYLGFAIF